MNYKLPLEYKIQNPKTGAGASLRLDAALEELFPDLGLRARRRLWDWCIIRVNGIPRQPGFSVKKGDCLSINSELSPDQKLKAGIKMVLLTPDYVVLHKPRGMHTAHIAGSPTLSLERLLPSLWPILSMLKTPPPKLISRLDQGTSGLVLAARHKEAEENYRALEADAQVNKYYAALVESLPAQKLLIKNKIDMDNKKKSLVLAEEDPDPSRWTKAFTLTTATINGKFKEGVSFMQGAEKLFFGSDIEELANDPKATHGILGVKIKRGARHQIRAHLAHAGYPLAGDTLYGGSEFDFMDDEDKAKGEFILHHGRLEFPGVTAVSMPDELLWLN